MKHDIQIHTDNSLSTAPGDDWTNAANDWLLNFDSERTRQAYSRAWEQFIAFTGKHPGAVTQSDVIAFKAYLTDAGQADSTVNLKLAALSSFYNFTQQERKLIDENPCAGVKRKNVKPYGKASYLNAKRNQDTLLLDQPDTDTLIGKRDYAIMLMLLTTGVRVSALANARVGDIKKQATGYVLQYTNKGGESQAAEVLPFVYEALVEYWQARGNVDKDAPLFQTVAAHRTGKQIKPLTRYAITAMISRYAEAAGLHHVTAHSLRHTAAMIASEHGTIAQVKAFLRHSSARTTAIYLDHVADSDVHDITQAVGSRYED